MKGSRAVIMLLVVLLGAALACGAPSSEPPPPRPAREEQVELEPEEPPPAEPEERVSPTEETEPDPPTEEPVPELDPPTEEPAPDPPTEEPEPDPPTEEAPEPTRDEGPDITDALKTEWFFGGGGGAGGCGVVGNVPEGVSPPDFTLWDNILCVWGFPLDEPLNVRLHAPDGRIFEGRYIVIEHETFGTSSSRLFPEPPPGEAVLSFAGVVGQGVPFIEIHVDWPVGTPAGIWPVEATSGGVSAAGSVEVFPAESEAISVLPDRGLSPFENLCEDNAYGPGDRLNVLGVNFPPGADVALGVYFQPSTSEGVQLVFDMPLEASGDGEIAAALVVEPSDPAGKYWVVATSDPSSAFQQDGNVDGFVYGGARTCFTIRN